jgi:glucan biosynthesis protein C
MSSKASAANLRTATGPGRVVFIDWLRVLAMVSVFFFHNAKFFDVFGDWHVKNGQTAIGPSIVVGFLVQWMMPLFFFLAGAGAHYALRYRSAGGFARERVLRLLVPLVFGVFVTTTPQAYFELVSHFRLSDTSFLQFYPMYVSTLPVLNWFHLWFLAYLFVFSVVALPLIMARRGADSLMSRVAALADAPWKLVLMLLLPLIAANTLLNPAGLWGSRDPGGWSLVAYFLFFLSGSLVFSSNNLLPMIRRVGPPATYIAVLLTIVLSLFFVSEMADPAAYFGTPIFFVVQVLQSLNTWCLIFMMISLGSRYLNSGGRFLAYANEAVLPFYVLHQTIIVSIGFYVVQWDLGIWPKYFIIALSSFVVIMVIYEVLVRRIKILRFLFGMKPRSN